MKLHRFSMLIVLAAMATQTQALQADREKPMEIFAQHFMGDEIHQRAVYTGDVEVHQGTLDIRGTKLDIVIDPEGYRTVTIYGKPVRMKEKRDNANSAIDEWSHLQSNKAVYKEKESVIVFSDNARFHRTENGLTKDATSGDVITYDLLHATTSIKRSSNSKAKRPRVSTVLAPRQNNQSTNKTAPEQPNSQNSGSMRQSMTLKLN